MSYISSGNSTRLSKRSNFPRGDDYLNELILTLKKSRSAYVGVITKLINKLTKLMTYDSNVNDLELCELNPIHHGLFYFL